MRTQTLIPRQSFDTARRRPLRPAAGIFMVTYGR